MQRKIMAWLVWFYRKKWQIITVKLFLHILAQNIKIFVLCYLLNNPKEYVTKKFNYSLHNPGSHETQSSKAK